jgi:Ni/Co efflux regulator RcnB
MKKSFLLSILFIFSSVALNAESNATTSKTEQKQTEEKKNHVKKENNSTKKTLTEQKIKEQMEREKKYAKEQKFYQGDEYDLKAHEVDPNSLPDVPVIEPDYDFDITDVYRDDI